MAKRKQTAGESLLGGLAVIGAFFLAVLFLIATVISNFLSVSAFVDYGPGLWFNNVVSFQIDDTYQATQDLPIYAKASITSLDEAPLFTIPAGHLFKVRGDIGSDEVDFLAVQAFDGTDRKLGFAIVAPAPSDPNLPEGKKNPRYIGILNPSHPDFPIPNRAIPYYTPNEEGAGPASMLYSKVLTPSKFEEIRGVLTLDYATNAFDRERIKEADEWVTVEELSDNDQLAYIPASEEEIYDDIVSRYARGRDMMLHQIDPTFDGLSAIRAGQLPVVPSYGFHQIVGLAIIVILFLWISASAARKRGRIACSDCGHKSHDHELVRERQSQRYKHQTKSGNPDARYKDNPVLTTTARVYNCEDCGEAFRYSFTTG